MRGALATFAVLVCLARGGAAQLVPLDPVEFQVNTCMEGPQHEAAFAPTPEGSFVVVWSNDIQGSNNDACQGIRGRRLGPGGSPPAAPEIQISVGTLSGNRRPEVDTDAVGNFVVVWDSLDSFGSDTDMRSIQARRYRSEGTPLDATEFQVNTLTEWIQKTADVAVAPDGDFVIVWESWDTTGNDDWATSIQARRFRADGTPLDLVEFQVNTMTAGYQLRPRVASLPHGGFVVAWTTYDYYYFGVAARRFGPGGEPLDAQEIPVNVWEVDDQEYAEIAASADGSFVVVWESRGSFGDDDDLTSIQMRQFDQGGQPLQPVEVQVNTFTTQWQAIPSVAADPAGNFVVGWLDLYVDGGYPPTERFLGMLRRFSAGGEPIDLMEFEANALEEGTVDGAELTPEGVLGVLLSGRPPEGDPSGILARRFSRPTIYVGAAQDPPRSGCTLVDALTAANSGLPQGDCPAGSGGAVVHLPEDAVLTFEAAAQGDSAMPVVTTPITIVGHGATVQREIELGCPGAADFRLFEVAAGGFLSLRELTLRNGCVSGGAGGAILASGSAVRLEDVTISDNRAGNGAGVALAGATLEAVDTTLERNVASGSGGGVAALDALDRVRLDRVTLAHNSASAGGGLSLAPGGSLDLLHGTLSANAATIAGGGVAIDGAVGNVALLHSTISGNSAPLGSALSWESGALAIHDSLVGDGTGGNACASTAGSLVASGWSLATDSSCSALAGGAIGEVGKLGLGPLRDHGGLVVTHLPLAGSPALDAAPACAGPNGRILDLDARRYPRPTDDDGDGDALCDIGAVERGPLFLDGFESGDTERWVTVLSVGRSGR